MTPDQVTAVAATGESETLEFTSTTGTRREAASTVCAMLNQRGGYALFDVTPTGDVAGQQVSERTIEEVSAEIQRIDARAFPEIQRVHAAEGPEMIAVRVNEGFRHGQFGPSRRAVSDLMEHQRAVLELLDQSDGALALREIRSELGPHTNERRVREDLAILKAHGLGKSHGSRR